MSLGQEFAAAIATSIADDPELARDLAEALSPYRSRSRGWLSANDAVAYLGLGSLDALDRLTREGLPCSQPHGPGGRRYFNPAQIDRWMEGSG